MLDQPVIDKRADKHTVLAREVSNQVVRRNLLALHGRIWQTLREKYDGRLGQD